MQATGTAEMEEMLINYITSELLYEQYVEVSADTPLLGNVIDSAGLISLVGFIEEELGITIPDEALVVRSIFATVRDMVAYLSQATA